MRKLFALTLLLLGAFVLLGAQGITLGKGATYGKGMTISPGSSGGGGAKALIQHKATAVGNSPLTLTNLSSAVSVGDTVAIVVVDGNSGGGGATTLSITVNTSNTYYSATNCSLTVGETTTTRIFWIPYANITTNPPVIVATDSGGSSHMYASVREYSNVALQTTDDGDACQTAPTSTNSQTTPTFSSTGSSDVLLEGFIDLNGVGCPCSYTASSPWSSANLDQVEDGGGNIYGITDNLNVAAGTQHGALTAVGTASALWSGTAAGLK